MIPPVLTHVRYNCFFSKQTPNLGGAITDLENDGSQCLRGSYKKRIFTFSLPGISSTPKKGGPEIQNRSNSKGHATVDRVIDSPFCGLVGRAGLS